MSSPDAIDPRFGELVLELRAAPPAASLELRERVREIVRRQAERPLEGPRLVPRRALLVLAPAAVAAVGAAVAIGVVTSGGGNAPIPVERHAAKGAGATAPAPTDSSFAPETGAKSTALNPLARRLPGPSTHRAQHYAADLTLRVRNLSEATKRALRLTRFFDGYVRSVSYGSGAASGTADLIVRIPIGRVQSALLRLSGLGTILDQHVSIQDVQPQLDRRFRRLVTLRREITALEERIQTLPSGSPDRIALDGKLERARATLIALRREQALQRRRSSFATVSLALRSGEAGALPPPPPGRIERALDRSAEVLVKELEILVYAFVIAAPFLVLGAAWLAGGRTLRRRAEERLLAR